MILSHHEPFENEGVTRSTSQTSQTSHIATDVAFEIRKESNDLREFLLQKTEVRGYNIQYLCLDSSLVSKKVGLACGRPMYKGERDNGGSTTARRW